MTHLDPEIKRIKSELEMRIDPDKVMYLNQLYKIKHYLSKESESIDCQIEDELHDAEKYLATYHDTGNRNYHKMAWDESTHAEMLIDIAIKQGYDVSNMRGWVADVQRRIKES